MIINKILAVGESLPGDPLKNKFSSPAAVIGGLLPYVYVIAGLILLLMLVSGGIQLMTSGGNPDKTKNGYGRITAALIGFLIIFLSYIIAKTVEVILGVKFM